MREHLQRILTELEQFGQSNDNKVTEHSYRMLNITRETGEFLNVLVRATGAQQILEIGTSNGYSTLWLADAAISIGGSVTTVEIAMHKFMLAQKNFDRAGVKKSIKLLHDDAEQVLSHSPDTCFDLIFLDSKRSEYVDWWTHLKRVLQPGGLLVVDNATSHMEELTSFVSLVESDSDFTTSLVPIGNGEFLAVKARE